MPMRGVGDLAGAILAVHRIRHTGVGRRIIIGSRFIQHCIGFRAARFRISPTAGQRNTCSEQDKAHFC